jgi:aspartyl-tRNA(Asn)/glutamyl-tRNA(Gln) amidotransferase subunit B
MQWEVVIGLETHVQLSTASKMFSGASTAFGAAPNSQASAVDIALPGVLPVANKGAVERAIRFGLAVGGTINRRSVFARKNYFYPDLPKGYQISQYELPIVQGGELTIQIGETEKSIRLTRAHLEEDAGKLLHEQYPEVSGVDLNRAGSPLLEIVSEPELRSAEEAVAYAKTLHTLVRWIDISDGNMQEGSFRCDANVSVRPRGGDKLGTRCEIKNLNSFRFLERAIGYEARRQIEILEDGGKITQETRLYDPDRDQTRSMRSKEDAHDYRYFPDPDLLPLEVSAAWVEGVRRQLPELPGVMRDRFRRKFRLSAYDASVLTSSRELAAYFERSVDVAGAGNAKLCANWIAVELASQLNREGKEIADAALEPEDLAWLVRGLSDGILNSRTAKEAFQFMWDTKAKVGRPGAHDGAAASLRGEAFVSSVIERLGLKQLSDIKEIEKIVDTVIAGHPTQVAEFRAGKEKAFNFFVGQVMKASGGKANPTQVNEILLRKLSGSSL